MKLLIRTIAISLLAALFIYAGLKATTTSESFARAGAFIVLVFAISIQCAAQISFEYGVEKGIKGSRELLDSYCAAVAEMQSVLRFYLNREKSLLSSDSQTGDLETIKLLEKLMSIECGDGWRSPTEWMNLWRKANHLETCLQTANSLLHIMTNSFKAAEQESEALRSELEEVNARAEKAEAIILVSGKHLPNFVGLEDAEMIVECCEDFHNSDEEITNLDSAYWEGKDTLHDCIRFLVQDHKKMREIARTVLQEDEIENCDTFQNIHEGEHIVTMLVNRLKSSQEAA